MKGGAHRTGSVDVPVAAQCREFETWQPSGMDSFSSYCIHTFRHPDVLRRRRPWANVASRPKARSGGLVASFGPRQAELAGACQSFSQPLIVTMISFTGPPSMTSRSMKKCRERPAATQGSFRKHSPGRGPRSGLSTGTARSWFLLAAGTLLPQFSITSSMITEAVRLCWFWVARWVADGCSRAWFCVAPCRWPLLFSLVRPHSRRSADWPGVHGMQEVWGSNPHSSTQVKPEIRMLNR